MTTASKPRVGDTVHWSTSQGDTSGKVVRKITGTAHVEGHTAKATKAEPQYEVQSAKTGKHAIHKAEALKRRG
ncbi:MAG: DUF2945 domain-containing protein [Comamonadaceae bacterium]|nr:MAG: DUF2945 domain-containing protein [Comamonadaceae bacterium]